MAWKKSAVQTFRFFAHGAFVLEPWSNAFKGKKLSAPNLILWICSYPAIQGELHEDGTAMQMGAPYKQAAPFVLCQQVRD
jgi:hypothetical protein